MNYTNTVLTSILLLTTSICGAQSNGRIIETTNTSIPRHECAAVAFEGELLLMGGRGIKPVEVFNPSTKDWKKLNDTPIEIHHFQPVVFGNEVYILSAFTGKYPRETPLEKVWMYNPVSDEWREGATIPKERRRGGAGVLTVGDKIYIAGGIIDGHNSGTIAWTDVFEPATGTWEQLPDMPNRRDHTAAVGDNQYMYLVGGRTSDYHEEDNFMAFLSKTTNKVDRYSFSKKKWDTLSAELPVPTAGGGAALFAGKIFYMGGETSQQAAHNQIQIYDINTGLWESKTTLERGRHGTHAVIVGSKIYIPAGSGNKGGGPELSTIESIDLR